MQLLRSLLQWFTTLLVPRKILKMREYSNRWKRVRAAHLTREPCCAVCGRNRDVEVHHIVPVHVDKDRELDPRNLITLCSQPCHIMFGHFFNYHCYNRNVRVMAAAFRAAIEDKTCLERFP